MRFPQLLGRLQSQRHKMGREFLRTLEREILGRGTRIERPEEGSPVIWVGSDFKIVVGSIWRLVAKDGVIVTGDDDGQWFGLSAPLEAYTEANGRLLGKRLKSVQFDVTTGDLRLQHEGDLTLEVITTSGGYESWVMWLRDEHFAVGAGSGLI